MNRYTISGALLCCTALFIAGYSFMANRSYANKAQEDSFKEEIVMMQEVQPLEEIQKLEKEMNQMQVVPHGPRTYSPRTKVIEGCDKYKSLIVAMNATISELTKKNIELEDKLAKKEQDAEDKQKSREKLMQTTTTGISALGGIASIILGIRKDRREDKEHDDRIDKGDDDV